MNDYKTINRKVMVDTLEKCETIQSLKDAIKLSIDKQYIVFHEEDLGRQTANDSNTKYIVSDKRSFEAAKCYAGKKVAVLNYANNHSVGGAPFSAGAQEESLCRCSTLYPCLQALKHEFYDKHIREYEQGIINHIGNDDLIYTPDVIVFKTDKRTDPIIPELMDESDWYKVNIITCAAPEMNKNYGAFPNNYEDIISSRIRKILDVASKEQNEVLILGAWGCGAFKNPSKVVAQVFHRLLKEYDFETVEFAMSAKEEVFSGIFKAETIPGLLSEDQFVSIMMGETTIEKEGDNLFLKPVPGQANNYKYIRKWFTPDKVTSLKHNQIFVYGSNIQGANGAGAARYAQMHFGAKHGVGVGRNGQCYAIPTMDGSVEAIKPYVDDFIKYAAEHKDLEFLLTPIGCGIAGYTPKQIAPLFKEGLKYGNIVFPKSFIDILIND